MATQIQVRRDTAANWTSVNPTLAQGEIGYETDTGKYKIGTGSATWTALSYAALPLSGGTLTGDLTLNAQADLRWADADSSNWVAFQAPATVTSNVTWTLPATDATVAGHALKSNAAGVLSWGTAGGATGGGTDDVFYENAQTVTTSYTLTTNKNAMSAGPITINSGATVTIPSGQTWVIV